MIYPILGMDVRKQTDPAEIKPRIDQMLSKLKEINEVLELGFADGSNRYDGNKPFPHPHVICTKCKKIIDPDLSSLKDMTKEVAEETGFQIITHRLDFFGICRDCRRPDPRVHAGRSLRRDREGRLPEVASLRAGDAGGGRREDALQPI